MKITIEVEDIEKFLESVGTEKDEWYISEQNVYYDAIKDLLLFLNKKKALTEVEKLTKFKD